MPKTRTEDTPQTRTRKPLSGLDANDITMLATLVTEAIRTGRKDDQVTDEDMARLYALKGKLASIAERKNDTGATS